MATQKLKLGDTAPDFNLRGTDNKFYNLDSFKDDKLLVVVFSCNHCPYVVAYEDRMIELASRYAPQGVGFVAINANETRNYPEDSFDNMVLRAREKNFPFPYVRDDDQSVAAAFGATHTPEFFLFDEERKLRYHGRLDDNWNQPNKVNERYLQNAIDELLAGKPVTTPETHSIGCTIKWG